MIIYKRVKKLEKVTAFLRSTGLPTEKHLKAYKKLRNELEEIRGDWKSINYKISRSNSYNNPYSPLACHPCGSLPAGSFHCKTGGCTIGRMLVKIFGNNILEHTLEI